jgi:tRNA modification GTPase
LSECITFIFQLNIKIFSFFFIFSISFLKLLQLVGWQGGSAEGLYMARERHVQALQEVSQHLQIASDSLNTDLPALDVLAEELRLAQNALNTITGEFTSDDLLGVIFTSFCIGK